MSYLLTARKHMKRHGVTAESEPDIKRKCLDSAGTDVRCDVVGLKLILVIFSGDVAEKVYAILSWQESWFC